MLRTASSLPLLQGFRHWAPTRPVSRPSRQSATGPPGSYPDRTSTGKRRRAYEHDKIDYLELIATPLVFCWTHPRSGTAGERLQAINFVAFVRPIPGMSRDMRASL